MPETMYSSLFRCRIEAELYQVADAARLALDRLRREIAS